MRHGRTRRDRIAFRIAAVLALAWVVAVAGGCRNPSNRSEEPDHVATRPIEEVLKDHTAELMAIPGVVGLYQADLKDGTPCIKVMVIKRTRELESRIPDRLEGYPVRIDETGVIRPMSGDRD